jgi:hypothetical protein
MAVTLIRSDQLRTLDSWDDTKDQTALNALEAGAVDMADVWEGVLSQVKRILYGTDSGNWYDDVTSAPFETLKQLRSHTFTDEKLVGLWRMNLTDVTVTASQNWEVLDQTNEPPDKNIAISASTKGAISAQLAGAVGSHSLSAVAGPNAMAPKNLCAVVDGSTGEPIEASTGERIWALLQVGSAATDGNAFATTGNDQGQLSFVIPNSTYTGWIACPVSDIAGKSIVYAFTHRDVISDQNEIAFRGDLIGADPSVGSVSLDTAYQGGNYITVDGSPVDVRLDDTKIFQVQVGTSGTMLMKVTRDDTGGDSVELNVDDLDVNNVNSADFAQGIKVDTGDQSIGIGDTGSGIIDSTAITLEATTGNALVKAASGEVQFTSSRDTDLELDDATSGPISALFGQTFTSVSAAIKYAGEQGGVDLSLKTFTVSSNYGQGVNVPGAIQDISQYPIDMNTVSTVEQFVFLNGRLLFGGNGTTKNDVYAGDTPASGDVKFDFHRGVKNNDVIISIVLSQ